MLSPRVLTAFILVGVAAFVGLNAVLLSNRNALPNIQGVVVPEGRDIESFQLVDQFGARFSNQDLMGKWTIVSYGFTDCPDICPTTLSKLAVVKRKLEVDKQAENLQILFYTIDPQRDSAAHLREYIQFFHQDFIALTYSPELGTEHIPFQRSLGIVSSITPLAEEEAKYDYKGYSVSHGVVLYLLNPEGKLQAILKPKRNAQGLHYFDVETVYADYLALRGYFG